MDWFTWIIWGIGFIILVIWILFPVKEFIKLMKERILK
jgi:hypothetical protein